MRITTQMLNESLQKAGVTTNTSSLLDYINKDKTGTLSDLFSVVSNYSSTGTTQNSLYTQLQKSADSLEESAETFVSEKEDNIFSQAREKESTEDIKKQLGDFISSYNDVMKKLAASGSTLNTYYKKMMKEAYTESQESLGSVGISADKNGYLSLNESSFDTADIDTLEKVLGKSSTFSTKTGYIAEHVSDNAESYLESSSSQYNSTGQNYSSYLASKYDIKG